jgi:CBS domain-containing protein
MEPGPSTYRPGLPAAELLERMEHGGFTRALVTDSNGRRLGMVERAALATAAG